MIEATKVLKTAEGAFDSVTLDETARHRRRVLMISDHGTEFLLHLEQAVLLKAGQGLLLDDGRIIEVRSSAEELYKVTADSPSHLLKLAWQIGNRHLPAQISCDAIFIRKDHVIKAMLEGLGASIEEVTEAFNPEGGAYGHHSHQHSHN